MYGWMLENWDFITFNMYAGLFVIFVLSLKKGYYKYQFGQLTWTVFSLAITMVQANGISENIMEGYFWFIFPAMLIACNDTMAYVDLHSRTYIETLHTTFEQVLYRCLSG